MVTINRQFLIKIKVPRKLLFFPQQEALWHQAAPVLCWKTQWNASTLPPGAHRIWSSGRKSRKHSTSSVGFGWFLPPKTPPPASQQPPAEFSPHFRVWLPFSLFYLLCPRQSSQVQTKWPQSSNKETNPAPAISYLTVGMRMLDWLYCLAMKPSS